MAESKYIQRDTLLPKVKQSMGKIKKRSSGFFLPPAFHKSSL